MTRGKKRDPRSEASQKRAIRLRDALKWEVYPTGKTVQVRAFDIGTGLVEAEFDLAELAKKRKPLTGVRSKLDAIVRGE